MKVKKIFYSLGALTCLTIPVATVISCSYGKKLSPNQKKMNDIKFADVLKKINMDKPDINQLPSDVIKN
jgi:hypothetical protein